MSTQEEDAANWRTIHEFKKARARLSTLKSQAKGLGDVFRALGNALSDWPDTISVAGEKVSFKPGMSSDEERSEFPISDLDAAKLASLTDEIRSTQNDKNRLSRALLDLEVNLED